MNSKNLTILISTAVVLGGAAYFLNSGSKPSAPKLNGQRIVPGLDVPSVAKIQIGEKLSLSAGADGWVVDSLFGYPAEKEKIAENLLKLSELTVGQVARGRKIEKPLAVTLKDAAGKELASLALGDTHNRKASGQMAMYGGGSYPDGRYLAFKGETVLVKDSLDAFDGDAKKWCATRIASVPSADVKAVAITRGAETLDFAKGTNGVWTLKGLGAKEELDSSKTYSLESALSYLDFASVADPKTAEAELGFATGAVWRVTYKDGTNTAVKVARVGNAAKGGSERYFKIDGDKWLFTISSYSAEAFLKSRADFVKAKPEPEPSKDEAKKDDAKKPEAKTPEAKKDAPKKK